MSKDRKYLYLHVPKTGGVSFRRVLEDAVHADQILHVTDPERFNKPAQQELEGYRLIHGHLNYGQISHLSGFFKIVSLRDPVSRCVSIYNFWRGLNPDEGRWSETGRKSILEAQKLSLEALIEHPDQNISQKFNNQQTWMLSGETKLNVELKSSHLQLALKNLEKFELIAVTEKLNLSKQLLCYKLGLYCPEQSVRLNESKYRINLTPRLRGILEEHNQLDLQLTEGVLGTDLYKLNGLTELNEICAL